MKLIKGNKVINATEKAYRVVYKGMGYMECGLNGHEEIRFADISEIENVTKAEIMQMLDERDIDYNQRDKKEELYNLLTGR